MSQLDTLPFAKPPNSRSKSTRTENEQQSTFFEGWQIVEEHGMISMKDMRIRWLCVENIQMD
jgi:hypothetical protein